MAVSKIRRLLFGNTEGDKLDDTPIELGAGQRRLKSASAEIQEQIAIQIAMKQASEGSPLQTIGEIEQELLDLEEDNDDPFFSPYEYIDMADELGVGELPDQVGDAPPEEGVNEDTQAEVNTDEQS